jgi:tetratricopeptide (TPR) repeat protein
MSYAGNAKLSQEIQNRILNTFQQTIALVEEGNVQEALLGCDFILRLDPLFEPARKLQGRLQESGTEVTVEDLAAFAASPLDTELPPLGEGTEEDADLAASDVETDVEDFTLPDLEVESVTPPVDDLASTFAELFAQREFGQILELAAQNQESLEANPDLRDVAESAQARLEAEPYVRSFLDSSRQAHQEGDLDKAQSLLGKARELDTTHPEILALEAELIPAQVEPPAPEIPESESGLTKETADWLDEASTKPEPALVETEPASPAVDVEPAPAMVGSEPAASLDTDSEKRIDDLLKEGQVAFEKGDYQPAIDAWSRIFLIDIDHAEASRRIELARKLKAEVERQIEEAFHEGISRFEAGETDAAREAFNKVLEMQSAHIGATEYLEKLDGGDTTASTDAGITPIPSLDDLPAAQGVGTEDALAVEEPIDLAPMPEPERAPRHRLDAPTRPTKAVRGKRTFLMIGAIVLLAVLAIGWYLYSRREQVFPNSETEETAGAIERADPLTRATQLHEAGNTALAIAQLRRLAPDHPQYAQAQTLIAQWEERAVEAEDAEDSEPTEDELVYQGELVAAAREALRNRENLVASELLDSAEAIAPLVPDDLTVRDEINSQLELIEQPLKLFRQGDWEHALPNLWRLHDEHPGNKDVVLLMVNCYFNLGLRDLQRGDPVTASEKFDEALSLAPEDFELQRLAAFASAYKQRPSDLLYRVFVKYHPFR